MSLFGFLRCFVGAVSLLALVSCAGARAPLETGGVDDALTLSGASGDPQAAKGRTIEWGGVVISATNLKDATRIEVLSYPLDSAGKPKLVGTPEGRFLALRSGYLETAVFAPGRLVTVVGPVAGTEMGKVGEMEYEYVTVAAEQIHLWPVQEANPEPRVHFGFGFGTIIR